MKANAPAKVNLSLRVFPPREDGYHPLDSLVQVIGIGDTLEAEPSGGEVDTLELVDQSEPGRDRIDAGPTNLVLRAVAALRAAGAAVPALHFQLRKDIPVAAGLGGGSGDAAAALVLAAAHAREGTVPDLEAVASVVGSDVPALLRGGTLRMQGRGDVLTELPFAGGYGLLLWVPGFGLPTPAVYRRFDEMGFPRGPSVEAGDVPSSLRNHAPLMNDLAPAAESLDPRIADHRRVLSRLFDRPILLSGSGTGMFCFFDDPGAARAAAQGAMGALNRLDPMARLISVTEPVAAGTVLST